MSTAKIIEVIAEGSSIDDAMRNGVKEAAKTVQQIQGVYLKDAQALVENGEISRFRATIKVTFVVNNS